MEGSSPAKLYAGLVGALLTVMGISGFFYISDFSSDVAVRDELFGVIAINGWSNTLHLLAGLIGLVCFMAGDYAARTYALVLGFLYLAAAIWGMIIGSGDSILSIFPVNTAGIVFDLALGLLGLAATQMWRVMSVAVAAGLFAVLIPGVATADHDQQSPIDRGRELFVYDGCANCHTLAESGSLGTIGPNLDQIKPDQKRVLLAIQNGGTGSGSMPQDLSSGEAAKAISEYVASASGGAPPPSSGGPPGKQVFTQNCGSCHTLADAGTSGNVGPDLDQIKPSKALVLKTVKNGKGAMPANVVSGKDAQDVADYVSSVAGK